MRQSMRQGESGRLTIISSISSKSSTVLTFSQRADSRRDLVGGEVFDVGGDGPLVAVRSVMRLRRSP